MSSQSQARGVRICVIIPTYNNSGTLARVVSEVLDFLPDVIVVDDGSTEAPVELPPTVELLRHERNRGKGAALLTAFKRARERGFTHAISIDSDGQHYPSDLPLFIKAILRRPDSIIVGNRFDKSLFDAADKMNGGSKFANKFSNFWFAVQTGVALPDTQTGFRAYPLNRLHWLGLVTPRYEAELELMVFASWHGVHIESIPIRVYYPPAQERVSHFRPASDFARISVLNTILCVLAIIYALPRKLLTAVITITVLSLMFLLMIPVQLFALFYIALRHPTESQRLSYHEGIRKICLWLLRHIPGVSFETANPAREKFEKPAVFICNHQSHLDPLCVMTLTPKLVIVTKKWVWNNPLYALAIRCAEFLPASGKTQETEQRLERLIRRGYSVLLFPEGTRSESLDIARFHQGAFRLALKFGIDILPIFLHGTGMVLNRKAWTTSRGSIYMEVNHRISLQDGEYGNSPMEITRNVRKYYLEHYEKLCREN